jgi:hypothetical protein
VFGFEILCAFTAVEVLNAMIWPDVPVLVAVFPCGHQTIFLGWQIPFDTDLDISVKEVELKTVI